MWEGPLGAWQRKSAGGGSPQSICGAEKGLNGKEAGPQAAKAEPQTNITLITGQLL